MSEGNKKIDKANRVKLPVQTTLESGARWHGGVRQLLPDALHQKARAATLVERIVLPPRERQNALTMSSTPGLETYSTLHLLAHNGSWYRTSPEEALRAVAAPELAIDILALHSKSSTVDGVSTSKTRHMRYVHPLFGSFASNTTNTATTLEAYGMAGPPLPPPAPGVKPLRAAERANQLYIKDRAARFIRFFEDDPLTDEGPNAEPYGMAPAFYKGLRNLEANLGERYKDRHETQRSMGERAPRTKVVLTARRRLDELRFPAHGHFRGCRRGAQCIVQTRANATGRPDLGYTEREYQSLDQEKAFLERRAQGLPITVELDGEVDLCVDDWLYLLSGTYHQNQASKHGPQECRNPFSVKDTEYDRNYLIPEVEGNGTGIEGHVPLFLINTRQFEKRELPDGTVVNYWADTTPDFQPSLSEANTCFGAWKARPFAGHRRFVPASLRVFMPRVSLEQAANPAPLWARFLRECHPPVLADRVLLADMEDRGQEGKIPSSFPVAWLRRSLLSTPSFLDIMTPLAVTMTQQVFGVLDLDALLLEWTDLAFCTFERSVALWMQAVRQKRYALTLAPLLLFFDAPCYRPMREYWTVMHSHVLGMTPPPGVAAALKERHLESTFEALAAALVSQTDTHVLWAVALWRCAAAVFFDEYIQRKDVDTFNYQAHLFAHTHDDLLTHMTLKGMGDRFLFAAPEGPEAPREAIRTLRDPLPWLALFYPAANRLCCAEEMVDLAPTLALANPWYDAGSRKTLEDVLHALLQIFLLKVMPHSCQRRGYTQILDRKGKAFPVLDKLSRLIAKCVLLGNLPHAISRLPLVARLCVTASFEPFATPEVEVALQNWMETKHLTVWFLMREYFFFHVENTFVLEQIFADSRKWPKFKALVRTSNGETRRDIVAQMITLGAPISWDGIERVAFDYRDKHGKDHFCIVGRLMDRHDRSLKLFTKLKKGRFEEIFKKKARAIERSLNLDYEAARAFLQQDNRDHYCHLVAWMLAKRSHAPTTSLHQQLVIETRWFKWLGASKEGLKDVRTLEFEYYEYDTGDEGLKAKIRRIHTRCPNDYILFCVLFKQIHYYREQTEFVLPIQRAHWTVNALRAPMVEGWFATPPHVGRYHYCDGCHQWASRVTPSHPILMGELGPSQEALVELRARVTEKSACHAVLYGERTATPSSAKALAVSEQRTLAFGSNSNEASICSFRQAFVDPLNGQLFCRRGHFYDTTSRPAAIDPDTVVPEGDMVQEDPFDDLALGRINPKQWMKRHGKELAAAPQPVVESGSSGIKELSALAMSTMTCNNPLKEIDLMGIYKRLHGRPYGTCVYCGQLCEVLNCNKTEDGLSCGRHPLPAHYPDHHRLWLRLGITRTEVLQAFPNPKLTVPCFACRSAPSVRYVESHDFLNQMFVVPLCAYHFLCCSALIPLTPRLSEIGGTAVVPPPVRIDHIMEKVWTM